MVLALQLFVQKTGNVLLIIYVEFGNCDAYDWNCGCLRILTFSYFSKNVILVMYVVQTITYT